MRLARLLLRVARWKVDITVPDVPRCIICVAPHTSNWDFILGLAAYSSVGRKAGFLMKETWFFWPLGPIFRALGGVPVPRGRAAGSLTDAIVRRFETAARLQLAITPEGTRSRTTRWHTGFLHIARRAGLPVQLGVIDYRDRLIRITDTFEPTGDTEADLRRVKEYYRGAHACYPDKFTVDDDDAAGTTASPHV